MRKFKCVAKSETSPLVAGTIYEMDHYGRLLGDGFCYYPVDEEDAVQWLHLYTNNRFEEVFEDDFPKITIKVDGRKTVAKMWRNGKLIKERWCVCHEDDEFDYAKGVEIAIKRLFDWDYMKNKGEKENKADMAEVRYLYHNETKNYFGVIGEETDMTGLNGEHIHIGDVYLIVNTNSADVFKAVAVDYHYATNGDIKNGTRFHDFSNLVFENGWYKDYVCVKILDYKELIKNGQYKLNNKSNYEIRSAIKRTKNVYRLKAVETGRDYGIIGTKTSFTDVNGEPLCVGDRICVVNRDTGESSVEVVGVEYIKSLSISDTYLTNYPFIEITNGETNVTYYSIVKLEPVFYTPNYTFTIGNEKMKVCLEEIEVEE